MNHTELRAWLPDEVLVPMDENLGSPTTVKNLTDLTFPDIELLAVHHEHEAEMSRECAKALRAFLRRNRPLN